ncbi:MAG TPA: glycoside hydrolase family 130 protein [Holophagaceae bacterium]|nr:glycoside hydrolase family 130 protein [Holophagaceae bacterium]
MIPLRRHDLMLLPESDRVIIRPFMPSSPARMATIIGRALALTEAEVQRELEGMHGEFENRHRDLDGRLMAHYDQVQPHVFTQRPLSSARKLLIGALFSGEYAVEAAALFNPSIVPHPNQDDAPEGGLRFVMSLRATGEGHISSIEFRVGTLLPDGEVILDPISRFVMAPEVVPNPRYRKKRFMITLHDLGYDNECMALVMAALTDEFSRDDLAAIVARVRAETLPLTQDYRRTLESIQWLADSNYELRFPPGLPLSEGIIFPVSANESNGIEDARFVRFVDTDRSVMYYATYTAYNGRTILPQLIETQDFRHFRMLTLDGKGILNKGMALFPRRINGRYAMLSRQDDENLFIMFSDNPHYWNEVHLLLRPAEAWESVKVGNCGSPLETEAGWLVITHGVGPLRKYCIGAVLLDLHDPTRVIGRLAEPLIAPLGNEREGYVPNVVYSCGALIHHRRLYLPFALSDKATSMASVDLDLLLGALKAQP